MVKAKRNIFRESGRQYQLGECWTRRPLRSGRSASPSPLETLLSRQRALHQEDPGQD